jgi:tRNA(adenine34) deaminase
MREALALAREAMRDGDVPVGCVVAGPDGVILGRGRNRRESGRSAVAHAEIEAITEACRARRDWRLSGCAIFVTLEPCPMCAGAILNSRIARVYYGAREARSGACGSVINLFMEGFENAARVEGGVLERDCAAVLRAFFEGIRE